MATILDFPGSNLRALDDGDQNGDDKSGSIWTTSAALKLATASTNLKSAQIIIFTGTRIERIDTDKDKETTTTILDTDQRNRLA